MAISFLINKKKINFNNFYLLVNSGCTVTQVVNNAAVPQRGYKVSKITASKVFKYGSLTNASYKSKQIQIFATFITKKFEIEKK